MKQGKKGKLLFRLVNDDYVFSVIAKFTGVFLAVIYSIFYNRYLGASLKGEAAIISNYLSIISSCACIGMYQAYPFFKKKEGDIFYPFINTMTSLYLLLFAASLLFALLARTIDVNLRIAVVLVPLHAYIRHINYVVMIEEPRRRNVSSMLIHLSEILVIVAFFAFSKASYRNLVLILIIQAIINLALSYENLKAKLKHFHFTLSRVPKYAKFGFIPMITLFLMTLNYRVDVLMLENHMSVSTAQIGIYSVGVALAEKVWLIPDAIKDILLSRLCKGKGAEEVAKTIRLNLAVAVILVILVAVLSEPFVLLVYGSEYAGAGLITTIMLAGVIGMIFYKMVYSFNISRGKRAINLLLLAGAAVANIIGNYFLIPVLGIYGAAWTSVISYNVCGIGFLIYFQRVSKLPFLKIIIPQKEDFTAIKAYLKKDPQKKNQK